MHVKTCKWNYSQKIRTDDSLLGIDQDAEMFWSSNFFIDFHSEVEMLRESPAQQTEFALETSPLAGHLMN
jgi:hypothetical protein